MDQIEQAQSPDIQKKHRLGLKIGAVALSALSIASGLLASRGSGEGSIRINRIESGQTTEPTAMPAVESPPPTPVETTAPATQAPYPEVTSTPEGFAETMERLKASVVFIYDNDGNLICNGIKGKDDNLKISGVFAAGHCVVNRNPDEYQDVQVPTQDTATWINVSEQLRKDTFIIKNGAKETLAKVTGGFITKGRDKDGAFFQVESTPQYDAITAADILEGQPQVGDEVAFFDKSFDEDYENKAPQEHKGKYIGQIEIPIENGGRIKGKAVLLEDSKLNPFTRSGGFALSKNGYFHAFTQFTGEGGDPEVNSTLNSIISGQTGEAVGEQDSVWVYSDLSRADYQNLPII